MGKHGVFSVLFMVSNRALFGDLARDILLYVVFRGP